MLLVHLRSHKLGSPYNLIENVNEMVYSRRGHLTDLAKLRFFNVASPRSPIFTDPVVPVMNMLSHFKSLWMIGGDRECRKARPFRICRHQDFNTFGLIFLNLLKYLRAVSLIQSVGQVSRPTTHLCTKITIYAPFPICDKQHSKFDATDVNEKIKNRRQKQLT